VCARVDDKVAAARALQPRTDARQVLRARPQPLVRESRVHPRCPRSARLKLAPMSATDADLRQAEEFVRELVEQSDGSVASVSCTRAEGLGVNCEVVLADGRTAMAVVEREGRAGAYFMRPRRGDAIKPIAPTDLIFMPDYGADPLWSADGGSMVPLERLPIGDGLRARIRGWASRWDDLTYQAWNYDDVANGMRDGPAEPVPDRAAEQLAREWRQLCDELRAELGAPWRVAHATFPNERHLQWEPDGPVRPG
jgi:hypothetical protein